MRNAAINPICCRHPQEPAQTATDEAEVRVETVDRLGQHRVTEAIDHVRELGHDRRIDRGVVHQECINVRLHLAGELFEHEMLILHLGAEPSRLEQALAVPFIGLDAVGNVGPRQHPLLHEGRVGGGGYHIP